MLTIPRRQLLKAPLHNPEFSIVIEPFFVKVNNNNGNDRNILKLSCIVVPRPAPYLKYYATVAFLGYKNNIPRQYGNYG